MNHLRLLFGKQKDASAAATTLQHDDTDIDDELLNAMEIFAGMSKVEMEETIREMIELVGRDDHETIAELEKLLHELIPMIDDDNKDDKNQNLKQMIQDDELKKATHDALTLLSGSSWDYVWENQQLILEGVLQSGQLSPEDAALYKADEAAWEKELKFIFNELQKQASSLSSSGEL